MNVVARCDKLDNIIMFSQTGHERNLVQHQLTIFAVMTACVKAMILMMFSHL